MERLFTKSDFILDGVSPSKLKPAPAKASSRCPQFVESLTAKQLATALKVNYESLFEKVKRLNEDKRQQRCTTTNLQTYLTNQRGLETQEERKTAEARSSSERIIENDNHTDKREKPALIIRKHET
jgi:hypothetical protein